MSLKPGNALCTYKLSNKVSTAKMYTVMHKCHLMSKPVFVYRKEHTMHMYQSMGAGKHVQVYCKNALIMEFFVVCGYNV